MYGSMQATSPSFAKAIGMQCVFSFGNRSVPNAKIVALSEINLAFGLKNGPARARRRSAWLALMARARCAASPHAMERQTGLIRWADTASTAGCPLPEGRQRCASRGAR